MKPLLKKDKASVSEESSSQRPKRSTCFKTLDGSNGLLWREETDLKRALYASLQETRKRNLEDEEEGGEEEDDTEVEVKDTAPAVEGKKEPAAVSENGQDEILKKAKVHAQRKFAQGTNPNSPVPTPLKVPYVNTTKELLPYKRPKTEDFLTFLCLRGTSILPPSLDFLNCCSKSDTSSDCRSLSPDPEAKDYTSHKESASKGSELREKNSARHENLSNGVSRKPTTCKALSKKQTISSQTAKKTGAKQKETNIVRKRKSRDDSEDVEFIPTKSSSRLKSSVNARTRSTIFHALREKYKKQRLAADKKKVPAQTISSSRNCEVKGGLTTRSQSVPKKARKTVSSRIVSTKRQSQSVSPVLNKKVAGVEQKLAVEKRKSLRSAHPSKALAHRKGLNKKTMWLRRAKMVPPIVDVESDSEPEILNPSPLKKISPKQEKTPRLSGRLHNKCDTPKAKSGLTSRQILLRKHMQSRLAAKKSALLTKNIKSKTNVKKTAKQVITKKVLKKNLVSKTMSLRKDLQNKRVTRSAKHQIEEMLWSHPEKKSKFPGSKSVPASRIDKKRISSDEQLPPKKPKLTLQKVLDNKQGKSNVNKEIKNPLSGDSNRVSKTTTASKIAKKGDAVVHTRSSKTVSHHEPKPGCSSASDNVVLQPKTENVNIVDNKVIKTVENKLNKSVDSKMCKAVEIKINKCMVDTVKKETPILNANKHVPKSSNSLDAGYREKGPKAKSEEQNCSKVSSKTDSISNIKSHNEKESNLLLKSNNLGSKHSSLVTEETSVQNNLNLHKNDKNLIKDISKLINLNVECEEPVFALNCEPSCSGIGQKEGDKKLNLKESSELDFKSELLPDGSFIKKHNDAKYIKNISYKEEKLKKNSDKNRKIQNKTSEKSSKSHKKEVGKVSENIKNKSEIKSIDKSKVKKEMNRYRKESILLSDSDSNTEIMENEINVGDISKAKNKTSTKEKFENKKNRSEKSDVEKHFSKVDQKKDSKKSKLEFSKDSNQKDLQGIVAKSTGNLKKYSGNLNLKNDSKLKADSKKDSAVKKTISILDQETDDDSDNDITLGEYLKLKSKVSAESKVSHLSTNTSLISQTKEINANVSSITSGNKDSKNSKKESEKEPQKSKKDGESSKHKKEKNNSKDKSSDKSFRKEDKMSRRDSEKSLAKLLKRERSKSSRKEEKLKHKRDGSSSSKSSKDKDGSKLSKKEGEKESSSSEKKSEFSDNKKDKSSKKESKLSRSNSYDDTKSPKKKKKLNDEFKQIEEIKNLISNSSILNEISGFKEFKRRLSGDKSELKKRMSKSKKRKKLALLKEKKLSKKLSSKLLRKYSKKKGLKKKNKLKKKELKKGSKIGTLSSKVHSKNKNKKHKTKNEHKKDGQEKNKNLNKTSSCSISTETIYSTPIASDAILNLDLPTQTQNLLNIIPQPVSSNVQTCTGDIVAPSVFTSETICKVNPPILNISIRESLDNVFSVADNCQNTANSTCSVISETTYPTESVVQATRNSISQVPLHFVQEVPSHPKTMTDAATNTYEDDLDETLSPIPELLRNVEMSVGTQTITPVGSPSPTTEMRSIVPSILIESPLTGNLRTNCINLNIAGCSSSKLQQSANPPTSTVPDKLITKCVNNHLATTRVVPKVISCANKAVIPVTQTITVPRIIPKTISSASNVSIAKGFTVSSGKHSCVNILPISPEKAKLSPYKSSSSLIIPVVTSSISNPLLSKNDSLPKRTICTSNPIPPVTTVKSSTVKNCVNNLIIPISPDKPTFFSSTIAVNSPLSPGNRKIIAGFVSNPTSTIIVEKNKVTNCASNAMCTTASTKPTGLVCLTKLASPISTERSTVNVSVSTPITTVTPEKSIVTERVSNPMPTVTTITTNSVNSATVTPGKSDGSPISNPTVPITPGKSKVPSSSYNTSQAATPSKAKTVSSSTISGQSSSPKVKKRNIKKMKSPSVSPSKLESFPLDTARLVSAPVYYPQANEFNDPLEYINKIRPEAEQYGICKIVPPASFKPECKVNDDMRFTAHNQYLHKMLHRWGPNVQHTACIRKHLKTQKVKLEQAPLIGGIEFDVSKFYHTVQQFGGLQQVIEKKKWQKVADVMRVPKTAQDRVTKLYDAYCKYLVSYDTLPPEEKQKIEEEVLADHEKYLKSRNSPSESEKEDEEMEDENNDCVTKGRSMSLSNFFRIARNTMTMWYKNEPAPEEVENEFWKLVTEKQQHVVVHAGNIDSSVTQSGFPTNKSPFAKHPWNLKILTNNSRSILKSMGPLSGITIPTLHVGMLFTTGCWYRDPHSFPWIEYLHTGASKIWYGIPANGCEKFRNAMKKIMPEYCTTKPLWLSSDTAMVPPDLLVKHGASLSRTIQSSGQFIVIFPESFTSTICCGYCVSESVYFAPTSWLDLAVKAFQDIQNSCESPAFSLERLLFSIGNDPKPQLKVHLKTLQKILPMIENIRLQELHLRAQLNELGLKQFERLPLLEIREKKKKSRSVEEETEQECEVCRTPCYVSMVIYPQEDSVYCLPHALEHIQKKNLKLCKLKYTYSEHDLNELIKKIKDLVSQLPSPSPKKKLSKKKLLPLNEK